MIGRDRFEQRNKRLNIFNHIICNTMFLTFICFLYNHIYSPLPALLSVVKWLQQTEIAYDEEC